MESGDTAARHDINGRAAASTGYIGQIVTADADKRTLIVNGQLDRLMYSESVHWSMRCEFV